MEEELQKLLEQLAKALQEKNLTAENNIDTFNIFEILGVGEKEVIVCRFLGNLLDPYGSHGLGDRPLATFLESVLGEKNVDEKDLRSARIELEDPIDNARRVDIAIHINNKVFPIEVKIWAKDQVAQLRDYYAYYSHHKDISCIYYLTPTGWEPSKDSQLDLSSDMVRCLSFEVDILTWLKNLEGEIHDSPIRQSLEQFTETIVRMCKNSMKLKTIEDVLGLSDSKFRVTPGLRAAIDMMNHKDELFKQIQKKYLLTHMQIAKGDSLSEEITDEDETVAKHSIMKVVRNGRTCAWICVETNLYVVAKFNSEPEGWEKYSDTDKTYWKYICPTGSKKKKFPLKELKDLPESDICLEEDLRYAFI